MSRIEFMTELASLLQDISVEERREAMQYYNNYFDDAGQENESRVIEELGTPTKVAREVKAGLKGQSDDAGEFTETGYCDTRFEEKEHPMTADQKDRQNSYTREAVPPRTSTPLKVILIVLIVLFAAPVALPVIGGLLLAIVGILLGIFVVFLSLVVAAIGIVIVGISLICVGVASMIQTVALGLALIGAGLLISVIGAIATVGTIRLCVIVFPCMVRSFVWMCRKPFERRVAA